MELNKHDIAERFAALAPGKQKEFLAALKKRGLDFSLLPIVPQKGEKRRLLSYAQQRHWFLWQLEPLSIAYHLNGALRLTGSLDVEALRSSFQALVARHESLRTVFRANDEGLPQQVIHAQGKVDIPLIDLSGLPVEQREKNAQEEASRIGVTPFDLTQGPLLRVALIRTAPEEHLLVVVMHHIISDAWSNQIVFHEFAIVYRQRLSGQGKERARGGVQEEVLPILPIQYADYAIWQRNWLEAGEKDRQLSYWRGQLGEEHGALQLPVDHPRSSDARYRAARQTFMLPSVLTAGLQRRAQNQGATLFMTLLAGFQALLQRYTGQNDIRIGVPIANRHRVEIQNVIGFFVNTQVLRNSIDARMTLKVILDQAREAALGAQTHQDLPFEQLVEALQPERTLNQNPLFQVMYNHLREDRRESEQLPGLTVENYDFGGQAAQFELTLDTVERLDGTVEATLTYAAELFESGTVRRLAQHYLHLLHQLAEHAERYLCEIDLLSEGERAQITAWGVNEQRYGNTEPVHDLIERQVKARPEALALIFGEGFDCVELSYAELNRRANRLAHRLIAFGVMPEVKVGVAVERSVDMIVGLLAILKAGGAYVPLDPDYPCERLEHMVADSAIGILLTQSPLRSQIPCPQGCRVLELDRLDLTAELETNPDVCLHGHNLAYVIYTSGSTGKPKGVGVAHGPLAMHVRSIGEMYGMTVSDRELQFASINFDGAHERWLVPLAFGAALMPRDNELWTVDRTVSEIERHGITIACFTPGYLHQLAELTGAAGRSLPIRSYTVGGEAMSRASFKFVQETLQPPRIINGYGPTETVITPLIFKAYRDTQLESAYLPIGHPVGDRKAYILDGYLNPVPQGVAGELYMGGDGLARGYLNRSGLTAERFIADPFDSEGGRLYRTGDLARWGLDAQVEYLGRLDHQVKVRGFRIELGEIEAQLLAQPGIREAVVVARQGLASADVGDTPASPGVRLVAYISPQPGAEVDSATAREALQKTLPDYMIPSFIIVLQSLPLNPNGKVDRKALPEPEFESAENYEAPQGEVEEALAAVWSDVLGVKQVGRQDNFFELGGDSILSLQIVTKLCRTGWKITPRQLFERQAIAALAPVVTAAIAGAAPTSGLENENENPEHMGPVPMLPIQLEFFEQEIPARHHWNQAVLLKSRNRLQREMLIQALEGIAQHHDALRFRYAKQDGSGWEQSCSANRSKEIARELLWERQAQGTGQLESICNEVQRSLDLVEGPLLRAALIEMADGAQHLLLVIHHLVVDGVSWRILLEDLQTAYIQALSNTAVVLPEKSAAYGAWAKRLRRYIHNYADELTFWQRLADAQATLPSSISEDTSKLGEQASIQVRLDSDLTHVLLRQAPAAYRTQVNDLLLVALGSALCQWSGHEKVLVDLEGHGREDLYEDLDLSRTVGWFTCLYPVVLDASGDLAQRIKHIKESLRQVPHKGLGYGLFKYCGTPEQRQALAGLPKAEVVFNYLGQFDTSFDEKALWTLADEPVGDLIDKAAPSSHGVSINAHVYEGELRVNISYSEGRHDEAAINAFGEILQVELESLIAHCVSGTFGSTPSDFPLARITQEELDSLPILCEQVEDLYPLSPMQSGMLFHSVFDADADTDVYLNQLKVDIQGLDVRRFKAAWQTVMGQHETLRTGFLDRGRASLQWVAKSIELPFIEYDWRSPATASTGHREADKAQTDLERLAEAERAKGFDLARPPLMRIALVRIDDDRYHFIWTMHHLLLDGWSTSRLMGEVLRQYDGGLLLSAHAEQGGGRYRDFIEWLGRRDAHASEVYWRQQLASVVQPTRLASVLPNPAKTAVYGEYSVELEQSVTESLIRFSRREHITVNTLVQGAWALLLHRYTGLRTVAFGATVSGRPADLPGADRLLGLFINTLPMIVSLEPEREKISWLRDLQERNISLREHEQTPLYEIQRWGGRSGEGLFDSILVFENYPMDAALQQAAPGRLVFSGLGGRETTNYPMTVSILQSDTLRLHYSYLCTHFSEAAVESIAEQVTRLLMDIAQGANRPLCEMDLLSGAEQARITAWGVNEQRYGNTEPVHCLIERQVEARPEAVALIFGAGLDCVELSYAELNRRANRLAHRLIAFGVMPEVKVGVAVERSVDMIVGLLAILKAGGAYVPLDPDYPSERIEYMVADSAIEILLTQSPLRSHIPCPQGCRVLELDRLDLAAEPEINPEVCLHGHNLAYIIYTSGSTGKPKGVELPHSALTEHAQVSIGFFNLDSSDRMLQFSTLNFDGFVEQLFPPLCTGAAVVLRGASLWDSETFYRELIEKRITVVDLTTAYASLLLQDFARNGNRDYGLLRQVHVGGEAMTQEGINAWQEAGLQGVKLLNTYGPTEATVTATVADCTSLPSGDVSRLAPVPIGRPLAGRRIFLLDANLIPVPAGVPGELCIGGDLLARGYFNRASLTSERFIADPFDSQGGRLYRTGDLARWRADGEIEYLGRLDHQVKIRGFRIELGEIESLLLARPEVREAVVVVRDAGGATAGASGKRLVGYVSAAIAATADGHVLREALREALPDYMLPYAIVVLEKLPLNPNGKVDRKALPEPELANAENYEAPQGEVEKTLAVIWGEVLGIAQVGRHDNFFELGGDSILSLQIVTEARRAGWKIMPRQLFQRQTVATLAEEAEIMREPVVAAAKTERGYLHDHLSAETIARLSFGEEAIEDVYPLSPTQEGMLFHTLEAAGTGLYVNQFSVEVTGLVPERLVNAWRMMVARHPVLRTGFLWQSGLPRPLQIVFKQAEVQAVLLDWRGHDQLESRVAAYLDEDLKQEFDFLTPPLGRLSLIRIDDDRYRLVCTLHHSLLDGWSESILINEWLRCYAGDALGAPGPDYGHYVRWLADQDAEATKVFWQAELGHVDGATLLASPPPNTAEAEEREGFELIYTRLDQEETGRLRAFAQQQRVTVNTFVQAAWALLLQRHTRRETVVFGATIAGRPPSLHRADEIIGLFINTIPIPVKRRSGLTVAEYLESMQETNARLREYEHASLADVQRWAGSSGRPLFDSIVVFENFPIVETLRSNEFYGLRFGEMEGKGLTGYAMDLQVTLGETMEIEYAYGRKDFKDDFVLDLRAQMEHLMREMMANPSRAVGELGWMERSSLGYLFSLGRAPRPTSLFPAQARQPVHSLIERNATAQPNAIALLMGERELSYAALNAGANRLAHRLIRMGIGPEVRVGVALERSLDMIVTLLAVLKAGGAYVPLDPEYPSARLAFMMKDSGLALLITQASLSSKLAVTESDQRGIQMLVLDSADLVAEQVSNPDVAINEHNMAYIIYTSGSTGLPKGVAVAHGPLSMHCQATAEIYGMTPRSCELLFMSFSFDGAHERWLTALTVGAGLAIRDQELWTAEQTYDALHHYGITNAAFPPAYLGQVAEWAAPRADPPPVDLYVFGGEAMPKASYDLVRRTLRPRILINGYGPTETVVTPLIWKTEASNSFDCTYAPIGRPVGERTAYVLDDDLQLVPMGEVGELYIGGYGLARGYLGRAGLTAERFVADSFDDNGGRLYRTGDLVRWMNDGNIEYIGRADHQVKIRGFRIEPGEIEARIREVNGIADAAVVVHQAATGAQLVAYVVSQSGASREDSSSISTRLKQELGKRLPQYMLPSMIITLETMPRLPSGKLDRQALPEPGAMAIAAYRAPSTPETKMLAEVWQEVLGVERVGESDNFFALGGDSLSSLKVMARMRTLSDAKFNFKLRDLMQRPTIAGLLGLKEQASSQSNALLALNRPSVPEAVRPLFCIHAGLGTVFDYQPLARQFQNQRTVYGLPCRMLGDPAHRDESLEQMAKDYCGIIRSMQPEGPYHLIGWSLGGTLAAMIAARLEAEAQAVAFLGLVDPFIPNVDEPGADDWRQDFSDFVSVLLPHSATGIDVTEGEESLDGNLMQSLPASIQLITDRLECLIAAGNNKRKAGDVAGVTAGGYADMGAEELARIFMVARHLKAISGKAPSLRLLLVEPVCWWAAARPVAERLVLAEQISQHELHSIEIDADHFGIVRDDVLIQTVESALGGLPTMFSA